MWNNCMHYLITIKLLHKQSMIIFNITKEIKASLESK